MFGVGGGGVFISCCLGGGRGVFNFCCLGRVRALFFAVWAGACINFCCLGGGRVLFVAVWAGACFNYCCLGRGRVLFVAVWAGECFNFCCLGGDGNSLSYRPVWLVCKGLATNKPNSKNENTGSALQELGTMPVP